MNHDAIKGDKKMGNLHDLTLREKIGQLMMVGFHEQTLTKEVVELIAKEKIGSIILFARNIKSMEQTRELTEAIQEVARKSNHPFPMVIATDQENGIVRRLATDEFTKFPGNMLLGAVDDENVTYQISRATAKELKATGINMNLAPVLDVNNNPQNPVIGVRAFGENCQHVAKHGTSFIKGHQKEQVITSAKHFPGHGNTASDSHLELPWVESSIADLKKVELVPFKSAIAEQVDSIMVNHVYYPTIDQEEIPASISRNVISNLLRKELGFDGVVLTDCLEMHAVSETVGTPDAAVRALQAGADIVMVSHTLAIQRETINRIEQAVKNGELSIARIDESVQRAWKLKESRLTWQMVSDYDKEEHEHLAITTYKKGVTVVNQPEFSIEPPSKLHVIWMMEDNTTIAEDVTHDIFSINSLSLPETLDITEQHVENPLSKEDLQFLGTSDADVFLFMTNSIGLTEGHRKVMQCLHGKQVCLVALKSPYLLLDIPKKVMTIATYEPAFSSIEDIFSILLGKQVASGKAPVTLQAL